jgi:SAM-dependent methyltransferase
VSDADFDLAAHWDARYATTVPTEVSWFEEHPTTSIDLIHAVLARRPASIVDVGGGSARLVDDLLREGHEVTVVDISEAALELARDRCSASDAANWVRADVLGWEPARRWDVWHDRAMLHFLTDPDDRARYAATMRRAIGAGGGFVIGGFAEDGPTYCSGLPVRRANAADLRNLVGDAEVVVEQTSGHITPSGAEQRFRWLAGRLR